MEMSNPDNKEDDIEEEVVREMGEMGFAYRALKEYHIFQ